ncbi:Thioredoxin-like fold [Ostreococcus tauri]|uniref:Thioredoxin-like fold n=1 Tax=Ostreococcus tauri TaxID=70448 RepID=A0A090M473_OSTTA|nr:Thioredoxin-like fold [Ostreococcus tauri]CEF99040.1 Thioredoxin-like fold [Ostreococcus tauri]|eukprot:XP_022839613.1 Thioredoxin-like fold [Ostreococcus tauri]
MSLAPLVHVLYCGYSRFATAIERAIHSRFPSARVECEPTTHASGALEITVRGVLVHSKLNGDGYVDGPEKIERVCWTRWRTRWRIEGYVWCFL